MPASSPPFKRLMASYVINPVNGCWEWTGGKMSNGYGRLKVFGKWRSAHSYSFELHKGPIAPGLEVLHSCDNKPCINPDHLHQGTHERNMREAAERGRMLKGANHPRSGKPGRRGIESSQSVPVRVLGKLYGSKNEAEKALGLGSGTVSYWIQRKPQKAQAITREEFKNAESM